MSFHGIRGCTDHVGKDKQLFPAGFHERRRLTWIAVITVMSPSCRFSHDNNQCYRTTTTYGNRICFQYLFDSFRSKGRHGVNFIHELTICFIDLINWIIFPHLLRCLSDGKRHHRQDQQTDGKSGFSAMERALNRQEVAEKKNGNNPACHNSNDYFPRNIRLQKVHYLQCICLIYSCNTDR